MPLTLDIKPHEKLFIGGAVLVNGANRCQLTLLNDSPILREREIMTEAQANTPCKRIYLAVQLMYMDPSNLAEYHQIYWELAKQIMEAAPSTSEIITRISEHLLAERYYPAMKVARELIEYEKELMNNVQSAA
jgi:flagellar protein FlbT